MPSTAKPCRMSQSCSMLVTWNADRVADLDALEVVGGKVAADRDHLDVDLLAIP